MSKKIAKKEPKQDVYELRQKLYLVLAVRNETDRCIESLNKLKETLATIKVC